MCLMEGKNVWNSCLGFISPLGEPCLHTPAAAREAGGAVGGGVCASKGQARCSHSPSCQEGLIQVFNAPSFLPDGL